MKNFTPSEAKTLIGKAIDAGMIKLIGPSSIGDDESVSNAKTDSSYLRALFDEMTKP